jgi:transcriptional regulator with XRE-family HTH domain
MKQHFYHYGLTIKKYRELRGWTQAKLAQNWLRSDKERGVNTRYIQDIEYGTKHIDNPDVLRDLSLLLDIPLWEFGLSEYNPFDPSQLPGRGKSMYDETLNVTEALIKQTLSLRRIAPLPEVQKSAKSLDGLFTYFQANLPPPARLESRFLSLYTQHQQITGLMYFENNDYARALQTFEAMYGTASQLGNPTFTVHALQKMGVELKRAGRLQEAVNALEEARDTSFQASKHVQAFANAYLAHIYATTGDTLRFERAINTAQSLASSIQDTYGDGTDFVFQKVSGILILRSRGYLRIKEPMKVLQMHDEAKNQVASDSNLWLDSRLYLYRARAYLMLREIEATVLAGREYFQDVIDWQSPHRTKRAYELLEEIEEAGYGNEKDVKEFRGDLLAAMQHQV